MKRQADDNKTGGEHDENSKIPFWRVVLSVIQASFGVQSARNRERDFSSRSVWPFVAAALIFTVVFVLALILVVKLVLPG